MKKLKISLILILFFCLCHSKIPNIYASDNQKIIYVFPSNSPVYYKVFYNGYVSFSPENVKPVKNEIIGNFILKVINTSGPMDNLYNLKLSAIKSAFTLDGHTLENTTSSDTEVSKIIPEMDIQMNKRGKIINSSEGFGLFDFMPFIKILPSFPKKIVKGKTWVQIIPPFNSPLGKMPFLRLTYVYAGKQNGLDKFDILTNQFFNQEEKENNIQIKITGLNASTGEILFNPEKGTIKLVKINLNISPVFTTFMSKSETTNKKNPIPYNITINIYLLIIGGKS